MLICPKSLLRASKIKYALLNSANGLFYNVAQTISKELQKRKSAKGFLVNRKP